MICIHFQLNNLRILMYHSVLKVFKKVVGLSFYILSQSSDLFTKSSNKLNKNTLGVKKVQAQ